MKKTVALLLISILTMSLTAVSVSAAEAAGSYNVNAELSCYVNAMGGVEFGGPLLTGSELIVSENGEESIRLSFTKSSVTIYSVTCDTFIDPDPNYKTMDRGVMSGTIGFYDVSGKLITEGVTYTLSEDTALNAANEAVHFVDSITFPIDSRRDVYHLTLYINSNVMGVQFTEPNAEATAATYPAVLTIDWSSLKIDGEISETSNENDSQKATSDDEQDALTEKVDEMEGLNIHRVGDNKETDTKAENDPDSVSVTKAYLNKTALVALAAIGGVILVVGIVVFALANRKKTAGNGDGGKKNDDEKK